MASESLPVGAVPEPAELVVQQEQHEILGDQHVLDGSDPSYPAQVSTRYDSIRVLSRALDQAGDVLARVRPDQLDAPTPCKDWTVGQLVDHLVADPGNFVLMLRGEQPDWSSPAEEVRSGWTQRFRVAADDLIHVWHQLADKDVPISPDFMTGEFAAHTWDVARAIGLDTDELDPEVAERGMSFMSANLTADNRGPAFGPEQEASSDAGPYERLAAFTGRTT